METKNLSEQVIEFHPSVPYTHDGQVQFDIPESFTQMTDPNLMLYVKLKVTKGTGENLAAATVVAPVNLLLHSLWRDVVVKANGVIIHQTTNTYPYKAYMETVFTYSSAAKNGTIGAPQLFYKDTVGRFNDKAATNPSFITKQNKFANSREVEMMGRLHVNLLLQNKLIVPGVALSITLFPSADTFRLMSGTENPTEKINITTILLKVRRIALNTRLMFQADRSLYQKTVQYPVNHSVVRTKQIVVGTTHLSNYTVVNGQIPRLIICAMVKSTSFVGRYDSNPF